MTKAGFKSVTIPDALYWVLSTTAKINKISISKVIEQGVLGVSPMPSKLITRVQIPIGAYPDADLSVQNLIFVFGLSAGNNAVLYFSHSPEQVSSL